MPYLTDTEQARIRRLFGYPALGDTFLLAWGIPHGVEFTFLLNKRMAAEFSAETIGLLREDLGRADETVNQIFRAQGNVEANKVGSLEINQQAIPQLERQLTLWVGRLADSLAIPRYPNAHGHGAASGGLNARVAHA